MNILLINAPSRKGLSGFHLPAGLLYVGAIIERCGHQARIFDPYLYDVEHKDIDSGNFHNLNNIIEDFRPSIIGYGGIVTSYGRTKKIARNIKNNFPDILQIAGGPLSSVAELLLTIAGIDIVFHGETEISLPIFLEKYKEGRKIHDTPGISYLSEDRRIITTCLPGQIEDLDSIPLPAYHLIDIKQYLGSAKLWIDSNKQLFNLMPSMRSLIDTIGKRAHYISIVTARGCMYRCSFCYRHMRGVRQHSPNYVVKHIKYIKDKYGIEGFQFSDELSNANPEWIFKLCNLIKEEGLDIFYLVGGARVDKMSEGMLRLLKETGCIEINYGQESGSDIILKEYKKGVTVEQNKEITLLTQKIGITCPVQIVIGSPSETNETILETIKFLKSAEAFRLSWNYLIPLPETPIWEYVKERNLIIDIEKYLDDVAEYGGLPLVNLTKAPDEEWKKWSLLIRKEMNLHYYSKTNLTRYYFYKFLYILTDNILSLIPGGIKKTIPRWAKSWYWTLKA